MARTQSRIEPCLWLDDQAEEAANFYVSVFRACGRTAELGAVTRYGEGGPRPAGMVMTVDFILDGIAFMALNAGPQYPFTPAVSFTIRCADQGEVDRFWDALCEGGQPVQCGWLTDRYGLSWQITPDAMIEMIQGGDAKRAAAAIKAMMGMVKLDIAELKRAYDGAV